MCPTLIWSTPSIELYNSNRQGKVEAPQTVTVSNLAGETLCFILHFIFWALARRLKTCSNWNCNAYFYQLCTSGDRDIRNQSNERVHAKDGSSSIQHHCDVRCYIISKHLTSKNSPSIHMWWAHFPSNQNDLHQTLSKPQDSEGSQETPWELWKSLDMHEGVSLVEEKKHIVHQAKQEVPVELLWEKVIKTIKWTTWHAKDPHGSPKQNLSSFLLNFLIWFKRNMLKFAT